MVISGLCQSLLPILQNMAIRLCHQIGNDRDATDDTKPGAFVGRLSRAVLRKKREWRACPVGRARHSLLDCSVGLSLAIDEYVEHLADHERARLAAGLVVDPIDDLADAGVDALGVE